MTVTTFHTVLPAPQQPRSKEEKQSLYTNTSVQMDLRPRLYFLMSSDSDETMKGCLKYVFLPYGWIFVFAVTWETPTDFSSYWTIIKIPKVMVNVSANWWVTRFLLFAWNWNKIISALCHLIPTTKLWGNAIFVVLLHRWVSNIWTVSLLTLAPRDFKCFKDFWKTSLGIRTAFQAPPCWETYQILMTRN